jgi:threonine/homoserine/homoserine lactone efflux protein
MTWFALVAAAARQLGQWLRRPGARRWTDRAAGTELFAFAARLVRQG